MPSVTPVDLTFLRTTNIYYLENGTYQRKLAFIRLLLLEDAPEEDTNSCSMAKVLAEIQIDIAQYIRQGKV